MSSVGDYMLYGVIRISFTLENVTYFLASTQYNTQLSSFVMLFVPFMFASV